MEASKLSLPQALTFNDVLLLPGYSDFSRADISLETNITKKIKLQIPFVSSPMDTVTESKLAIALASIGGLGIIHRNLSIEDQADEVQKVKRKELLVGAAIGPGKVSEDRIKAIALAGADIIVIDSAHGFTKTTIETIAYIKNKYKKIEVIAGSIATYDATIALIKAGADGLRIGMGPGAICTTRVISGMGVPQITAIFETSRAAKKTKTPIIADGGLLQSGDMAKALAAGASTLMMGSFFASTHEAPGRTIRLSRKYVPHRFQSIFGNKKLMSKNGDKPSKNYSTLAVKNLEELKEDTYIFKEYRGMGSEAAMNRGAKIKSEGEFHGNSYKGRSLIAEGVEGLVPIKGSVAEVVDVALGGIKSGFYYCGFKNIQEAHKNSKFIQITQASLNESHPHDVLVTNAGKSYTG